VFASANHGDRTAANRSKRSPVPPKFLVWTLVVFVVLGLGGELLEHYYGNIGLPTSKPFKVNVTRNSLTPISAATSLSLAEFINLKEISNTTAPPFTLRTQSNRRWSFAKAKGKAVVLTFENSICNDICPILDAEIKETRGLLGAKASRVDFVVVNTDPKDLSVNAQPLALSTANLLSAPNVFFLTGSLTALDNVWTSYGVRIKVGAMTTQVTHNNVMYFIGPKGHLVGIATPFAHEDSSGQFSLSQANINRFAKGIAETAGSLVK
jgi:cytochrome oxidase Cu insertion factor (SCO1/SenC/PrrC family)